MFCSFSVFHSTSFLRAEPDTSEGLLGGTNSLPFGGELAATCLEFWQQGQ